MLRRTLLLAFVIAALSMTSPSFAADQKSLELFGVVLNGATRNQLRSVFKQNGLTAAREDNEYWLDIYDTKKVLDGATELRVGYVQATGKFTFAQYKFPGAVDTKLVGKVINMVSSKYGRPTTQIGNLRVGPVTARWMLTQNLEISVFREWPDTSAYIRYSDLAAYDKMLSEIDANKKGQETQKNKAQSNAF